jgi:hypothetical protein
LIYFFSFIILLTLGSGLILEYFFRAEEVRALSEKEGKKLNSPLSIKKIKFSLLSGVRIDEVKLGPAVQPITNTEDGCGSRNCF